MAVNPLGGLDGSSLGVPLGFDGDVPLVDDLGFDADTSAYVKDTPGGPLGDATPRGTSYFLHEAWGGAWVDAEKTPSDTEDDLHCWAAAASNVLAWTGWGVVGGMTNTDQMFQYFQDHWTDQGGLMQYGWEWWFNGQNDAQGYSGWAQVDVPGGAFYLSENFNSYFRSQSSTSGAMAAIDTNLHDGYGVGIGIYGPGGHAITVWGYSYNPSNPSQYYGLWITDSDDYKSMENAPDRLRYYDVAYSGGRWYLQDYYGSDEWYIGVVQGLAKKASSDPVTPDPTNEIRGTVYNDLDRDGSRDTGEAALAGQTVYLDANGNGTWDHATIQAVSTDVAKSILDLTTVTSTVDVSGLEGTISDVNVTLNISHTYDADLTVYLISPNGARVQLFAEVGGSGNNFTNTTLDAQAATSILSGSAPFTGTFRPTGSLAAFNGLVANGTWTLEITDGYSLDQGTLNSWSLQVTAAETRAVTQADGSFVFTGLADGDYCVRAVAPDGWIQTSPAAGYYDVTLADGQVAQGKSFGLVDASIVDLGTVAFTVLEDVDLADGSYWYRFQATRSGFLTVEALTADIGNVQVRLFDQYRRLLATSHSTADGQRLDYQVVAGRTYCFRADTTAESALADLRVTNLVQQIRKTVAVYGTAGDDQFDFRAGSQYLVTVNGVGYAFGSTAMNSVAFYGGAGNDSAILTGSTGSDALRMSPTAAVLSGRGYQAAVAQTETIVGHGGGGRDTANLYDSRGNDTFIGRPTESQFSGTGFSNTAVDFDVVNAYATVGFDVAHLYDSAGNDVFVGKPTQSQLYGPGYSIIVKGFDEVYAHAASGGTDVAGLYDSRRNDVFVSRPADSRLYGPGYSNSVAGFDVVRAYATAGGYDLAYLYDSAGDDVFVGQTTQSWLCGAGFYNYAKGFDAVVAYANAGGNDMAHLYDSKKNDTFVGSPTESRLWGRGFAYYALAFDTVNAYATSGTDTAYLYDSGGDDTFIGGTTQSRLYGDGYSLLAQRFDAVNVYATAGGYDVAELYDSSGKDTFVSTATESRLYGARFSNRVRGFDAVNAHAIAGGYDRAYLYGSAGDNHLEAATGFARLDYASATVGALDFSWVQATSATGTTNTKTVGLVDFVLQLNGLWLNA